MFYTYMLRCSDGELYVGSTGDLKTRFAQHRGGQVAATAYRLPVCSEYYEACQSEMGARKREKQLKTGIWTRVPEAAFERIVAPRPQRFA
ncbi:MAG TPA: GIY-YIG nuclease family protein [Chthoniobacterales bacterium]|nr:GIY-YIG nuclease family protein [Chthoniobacterales bacterium]